MAHDRNRHIFTAYKKALTFGPILGLFGHRQVGKSTFLAASVHDYRTLDDVDQLESAQKSPKKFIQSELAPPHVIDECQLDPKLFPTLKEYVRKHKKPGQFILSGSVRFTSRKAIRESLAGRISLLELLPFSITEILNEPLSEIIPNLLQHKIFSEDSIRCLNSNQKLTKFKKYFETYLENGGMPGLCFLRNFELRKKSLNDLHDLMLGRDLRLVSDIKTPINVIKKLLSYIAKQSFEPYNVAEVKRQLGLAPQTQKSLLFAMESIFLIRRIYLPKQKKDIILLEDQFEELVYSAGSLEKQKQIESAIYRNLRTQFAYSLNSSLQFESYLTRDHARVALVLKDGQNTLGIIVTMSEKPTLSEVRSAASFLKNHANAKLLYLSSEIIKPKVLDDRTMLCSIYSVI